MIGIARSDLLEPGFAVIDYKRYAIFAGKAMIFIDFSAGCSYIYELLFKSPNA